MVVPGVQPLNERIAAGKTRASTVEVWARETLDNMSKFCSLSERLTLTVCEERMLVPGLVDGELLHRKFVPSSLQL